MSRNPDVTPVGFAATDAQGAPLRRRRNPLWLLALVVLAAGGLAGIGWFVADQVEGAPSDGEAVASGRVAALDGPATPAVRFVSASGGDYTVWLKTDGIANSTNRDTVIAATNCEARFAGGRGARFRGAIQGSSVTIGDRSTVGVFTAPAGEVTVACRQERFGRFTRHRRLRHERPFIVVPGEPGGGWAAWGGLTGGILALCVAPFALGRWRSGTVRAR